MSAPKSNMEQFSFQAEMKQLLHLITHSLYTHREIFLRELISNASDALNKLHFASLTDAKVLGDDTELIIKIELDETNKTLSISDNGIGMNKNELKDNIGTIAKSGTMKFMKNLTGDQKKDSDLIGRFGVGFYSVFMVADKVTLETKSYKSGKAYRWTSKGTGSYTVEPIDKKGRGTKISFKFRKDAEEFATKYRIESIIRKYSDFVSFPIEFNDETANKAKAIWTRDKKEVKEEEYTDFYKYIAHKTTDPLTTLHLSVEAPAQFKAILFVPREGDISLFDRDNLDTKLHLYVKRVFIQDDCKDLLPGYLRFVRGVVDSEDLSLNISREVTQHSSILSKINKYLVRKLLGEFQSWANSDKEKYKTFWEAFGNHIKEGIHTDFMNRDKLIKLFRCHSSVSPDELTSLEEYTQRMGTDQKEIYYVYGKNKTAIELSPNMEYFRKNNIEVLYLYEEIDDFIMPSIGEFEGKKIVEINQADLEFKSSEKQGEKQEDSGITDAAKKKLLGYFKDILGNKVEEVIESKRLIDSPCTLVNPKDGMSAHMERMMRGIDSSFQRGKRTFEINFNNPLIQQLSKIQQEFPQDSLLKDCIEQLYDTAALQDGSIDEPVNMIPRTIKMMETATQLHLNSIQEDQSA